MNRLQCTLHTDKECANEKKRRIITLISFRFRSEDQINDDLYISYTLHVAAHCTLYIQGFLFLLFAASQRL